tara:strand:+ start:904 stop:1320 length:417 start_codon:yes stop_codon:yes gene_type:complete
MINQNNNSKELEEIDIFNGRSQEILLDMSGVIKDNNPYYKGYDSWMVGLVDNLLENEESNRSQLLDMAQHILIKLADTEHLVELRKSIDSNEDEAKAYISIYNFSSERLDEELEEREDYERWLEPEQLELDLDSKEEF